MNEINFELRDGGQMAILNGFSLNAASTFSEKNSQNKWIEVCYHRSIQINKKAFSANSEINSMEAGNDLIGYYSRQGVELRQKSGWEDQCKILY